MKKSFDPAKLIFFTVLVLIIIGLPFMVGLYSAHKKNAAFQFVYGIKSTFDSIIEDLGSLTGTHPTHLLQPKRNDKSGISVNEIGDDNSLIMVAGFFDQDNAIRLIKRDGTVVNSIPARFSEVFEDPKHLFNPPQSDWHVDTHGAVMLPDGSTVFNFEYSGTVKLDHCGKVQWKLPMLTHHSLELADDGSFWVAGRQQFGGNKLSPYPPFPMPLDVDSVLHISSDGEVLEEILIPEFFNNSGLDAVLTANNDNFRPIGEPYELAHLNKVAVLTEEIAADFPMFEAGDLLISLRGRNLLAVLDTDTKTVKWWRIGPWHRQHDPEFNKGGWISLFNNNTYITHGQGTGAGINLIDPRYKHSSNIMMVNPETEEVKVAYGDREGEELLSVIRAKQDILPNDHILITEFEGGRVFEVDENRNVIWEFVNSFSDTEVAEITEARRYPADYFTIKDWSCPED